MDARRDLLVELADKHGPCSVRHLYYRAVVAGMPGITKDPRGYSKVQNLALELRRCNRISYEQIVDNTRWVRRVTTWDSVADALNSTAELYRRNLWSWSNYRVEVWCESDSIASTIASVTQAWTVDLFVARGYSSETFAHNAAAAWAQDERHPVVFYIGDHDPAGLNIEQVLRDRLESFSGRDFSWRRVGVTWAQVEELDLPGTTPKQAYGYSRAVEAEALPPRLLRDLLLDAIHEHVDPDDLKHIQQVEAAEIESFRRLANRELA